MVVAVQHAPPLTTPAPSSRAPPSSRQRQSLSTVRVQSTVEPTETAMSRERSNKTKAPAQTDRQRKSAREDEATRKKNKQVSKATVTATSHMDRQVGSKPSKWSMDETIDASAVMAISAVLRPPTPTMAPTPPAPTLATRTTSTTLRVTPSPVAVTVSADRLTTAATTSSWTSATSVSFSKSAQTGRSLDLLRLLETVGSPRLASTSALAPVSPRTALREATRHEQQRVRDAHGRYRRSTSALSTVNESAADEDQTTVKSVDIGRNRSMVARRGSASSASELAAMQSSLAASAEPTPTVSMSTWVAAAADEKVTANDTYSSSSSADVKTQSSSTRPTAVGYSTMCALMLQLYVCSAFVSARDEMAFVEKKRSVVELGHGETLAFVGLVSS